MQDGVWVGDLHSTYHSTLCQLEGEEPVPYVSIPFWISVPILSSTSLCCIEDLISIMFFCKCPLLEPIVKYYTLLKGPVKSVAVTFLFRILSDATATKKNRCPFSQIQSFWPKYLACSLCRRYRWSLSSIVETLFIHPDRLGLVILIPFWKYPAPPKSFWPGGWCWTWPSRCQIPIKLIRQ